MSRELKFRVWSFIDKEFQYFDVYDGANLGIAGGASEPQQFTGLKDKNGKEIYEGDYINFSYTGETIFTGFVRWFGDRGSFGVTVDNAFETFEELMGYWDSVEVVGNIFQQESCMDELAEIAQEHGLY